MKFLRPFFFAAAAVLAALLILAALACNSGIQTRLAHRILARRPELASSVGRVKIGLDHAELRDLRIEQRGAVLTLPEVEIDLPVYSAGVNHRVLVRRLTARDWTLDLRASGGLATDAAAAPLEVFRGIFNQSRLPMDFALDGLELEGDVILPPVSGHAGGRVHVTLGGGGLASGQQGHFSFKLRFVPAVAAPVNSVVMEGTLAASMSDPRTFERFALRIDATAAGPKLPQPVRLSADLGAGRIPAGETYFLTLAGDDKQLATLNAEFPGGRHRLAGRWKLDVCDADVAPFALGRALPVFDAVGGGRFDADVAFSEVHVAGALGLTADRLDLFRPKLGGIGAVKLAAEFDFTVLENTLRVDHLKAGLTGAKPILAVTGLQAFALNAATGELTVADPARDIFDLALQAVPVGWAQPFFPGIVFEGGSIQGDFAAGAGDGGLRLRAAAPVALTGFSATRAGRPLFENVSAAFTASADYAPAGWQVETAGRVLKEHPLFDFQAKFGRLAEGSQPIKAAGHMHAGLPALLGRPDLIGGNFDCDFTASLDSERKVEARMALSDLAISGVPAGEVLPVIAADVRADFSSDGKIIFNAPVSFDRTGRKSDLTVTGALASAPGGFALDGRIASAQLSLDDAKLAAVVLAAPFCRGLDGRLALDLKSVSAPQFVAKDVGGTLRFERNALKLDGLHATLDGNGDVKLDGGLTLGGRAPDPCALTLNLTVGNFDPVPVFRARYPDRMPTVDGKFDITGEISGRGASLYEAASRAQGDFRFESAGGVLRLFSTDLASKGGSEGRIVTIGSFIGDVASAVTGRKDTGQAIRQLARRISAIPYDQMTFGLSRDASLNLVLKDFALISPEIRLKGGGQLAREADTPLLQQPLTAEFRLWTRGQMAAALKLLGMLDSPPDDLGYSPFTVPLKIGGTLGKPDTSELQATLLKTAYDRSGAGDLLDKLLGK